MIILKKLDRTWQKINVDANLTSEHCLIGDFMDLMLLSPVCELEVKKELENITDALKVMDMKILCQGW